MSGPLDEVAELVRRESGITLQPSQHASLRAAVARAVPGADPIAFLRRAADPLTGASAVERLIDEVTVNETSFFRDWRALETVSWHLLREQADRRGDDHVRVWSAACSTGEEAYSLAIAACEAFASPEPPVRILATDISAQVLGRAWEGRYRDRSVRPVQPWLRERYFTAEGDALEIGPRARRLVEFRRHNLARDPIPPLGEPAFDLVVCRNVLIYFDPVTVERVIDGLEAATHRDGMLILGAADTLCGTTRRLARLAEPQAPPPVQRRTLRRPLGRESHAPPTIAAAVRAADEGRREDALVETERLLAVDPLDETASYVHGLVLLESGVAEKAVESLRRALYLDPTFGLAAFHLGRAYDELGDAAAASRSYAQALRLLDPDDDRHAVLLDQVDLGDVAAAARTRLQALAVARR